MSGGGARRVSSGGGRNGVVKMAALKEERSYGLSCGRVGGRVSVFHVKLTDSALRAFESYQRCQDSISLKPAIRFQGSQGQITIPRPECPTEVRTFTFYLSNVGRDSPQGSFECIQQYTQSDGNVNLDCLGCIQDKITVCATDDSYQKARQSMAQAEEENKSRSAIVIKMGSRYGAVKKVQVRKPAPGVSDVVPSRKRANPVNLASAMKKPATNISQRPFKDRVMHLLALKPYKKPELLLRLQKDGLSFQDKDSLDGLLQQVANLSAKDCTYTLKDCHYKEVHKDWPGYSEGDQQLLKRILVRKLSQPQTPCGQTGENAPLSPPKDDVNSTSPNSQKRPSQNPEPIDPSVPRKVRISHFAHRSQHTFNGKLNSSNGRDSPAPPTQPLVLDPVLSSSLIQLADDPLLDSSTDTQQKDCESLDASERLGHEPQTTDCSTVAKKNSNPTHGKSKKKSKKHKERDRTKEKNPQGKINCSSGKISGALQDILDFNRACSNSSIPSSTSELPDYILKYTAISSQEQRQTYKIDFNSEYNEYRDLHARIEKTTSRFTQLDAKLKQLCTGSEEYKTIHDQILQEYRKIKKSNPNYSEEKNRCEYLHNKLAHIKKLIAQYDQQQILSLH